MATRGVFQLQKLNIFYCEYGGSSKVIRDYLKDANAGMIKWAKEHPHVQIDVKVKNGKHPHVKADYLTITKHKYKKKLNQNVVDNIHQICLKSNKSFTPNIENIFNQLYNRSGRKIKKFTKSIYTDTPSIQGVWTPSLNLHITPEFPMTFVEDDNDGDSSSSKADDVMVETDEK